MLLKKYFSGWIEQGTVCIGSMIRYVSVRSNRGIFCLAVTIVFLATACSHSSRPPEKDLVKDPARLDERVTTNLQLQLTYAGENNGILHDSVSLNNISLINKVYGSRAFKSIWSDGDYWRFIADSLYSVIDNLKEWGLFSSDYPVQHIANTRNQIAKDSLSRQDAALWARADILLTETYFRLAKDLHLGRLEKDSITLRNDSLFTGDFLVDCFTDAIAKGQVVRSLRELEPSNKEYRALREALKQYLAASAASYVKYRDSMRDEFSRIAITLDRYKLLPWSLPETYVWVNLPSYKLTLSDADTTVFTSRIIVGTPETRTPVLNSTITNFITYPQWTVPYSIVFKEMLPGIQKDINYLKKRNLMVVDQYDRVIDPATIDWKKLSQNKFPYLIRQREGDDNSLGVMKFNFRNKYSVYLHDTNARSLFARADRALSHGCVRVEKWKDLANFLVRNDTLKYPADTLSAWMARQEKHTVSGFQGIPVYIRYFTVEPAPGGGLKFYRDIYKEDSVLNVKYFAHRKL